MAEGACAGNGECDWIAFAVNVTLIGVHLVEEDITRWHGAQADGGIGAGQHELPAREFLGQSTVLPLSRERDGRISARNSGLSSISGSMRCCDKRLARSVVG